MTTIKEGGFIDYNKVDYYAFVFSTKVLDCDKVALSMANDITPPGLIELANSINRQITH